MIIINSIKQVRQDHVGVTGSGDRVAVIVETPFKPKKSQLGVQFWTPEMIAAGSSINTDSTTSKFVETL